MKYKYTSAEKLVNERTTHLQNKFCYLHFAVRLKIKIKIKMWVEDSDVPETVFLIFAKSFHFHS